MYRVTTTLNWNGILVSDDKYFDNKNDAIEFSDYLITKNNGLITAEIVEMETNS